jgi:hypothetical protein
LVQNIRQVTRLGILLRMGGVAEAITYTGIFGGALDGGLMLGLKLADDSLGFGDALRGRGRWRWRWAMLAHR